MTQVFLIRHGQAQTGAVDEASYDSLSALGHKQAKWLGDHLAASGHPIKRVVAGDLIRQQETARHIASAMDLDVVIDPHLRELD